ncbi:YppG family protein [Virgibacillus flavescens]|uniref:YppG family protein n=1 Tax=Virgibacillus flavescens TaxID=1611422 RepID=UPI003D33161B
MINRPNNYPGPFNHRPPYPPSHQQWHQSAIPPFNPTPYQMYAKPKQPAYWNSFSQPNQMNYPAKPPGQSGLLNYFQNKNGEVDFDKMMSTVGQVANTFQQISPMVKQFGSIMKSIK